MCILGDVDWYSIGFIDVICYVFDEIYMSEMFLKY